MSTMRFRARTPSAEPLPATVTTVATAEVMEVVPAETAPAAAPAAVATAAAPAPAATATSAAQPRFRRTATAAAPTPVPTPPPMAVTKLGPAELPAVPVAAAGLPGQFEGDFDSRDRSYPYLSVVSKQSKAVDDNPTWIGGLLYDKTIFLGHQGVVVVFTKVRKFYEEVTEFDSGDIPQKWDRREEARAWAAGGADRSFREAADLDLLIECTDESQIEHAILDADGLFYMPARMTVRSSSYGLVRTLFTDINKWLKGDLSGGLYVLATKKMDNGKNVWYVPTVKAQEPTPENLRSVIREVAGV